MIPQVDPILSEPQQAPPVPQYDHWTKAVEDLPSPPPSRSHVGTNYVMSAGVGNLIFLPGALRETVRQFKIARQVKDVWWMAECIVRLIDIPIGLAQASKRFILICNSALGKVADVALIISTFAFQIFFVIVETALEITRYALLKQFEYSIEGKEILSLLDDLDTRHYHQNPKKWACDGFKRGNKTTYLSKIEKHRKIVMKHFPEDGHLMLQAIEVATVDQSITEEERADLLDRKVHDLFKKFLKHTLTQFATQYLGISQGENNTVVTNDLVRRRSGLAQSIRPVFAHEIGQDVLMTLYNLDQDGSDGIIQAKRIYARLNQQIEKTKKVYRSGLAAMGMAGIGIGISFSPPLFIPAVILGIVGTILELGRWFAPESYLDQKGEKWSWDYWTPAFIKKWMKKPIREIEMRPIKR